MSNNHSFASSKVGVVSATSHALLYVDNGGSFDSANPFAVVFQTQQTARRSWSNSEIPKYESFAYIGKITADVLPDLFYSTPFKDIDEAVEQVQYFFSLSEMQKMTLVRENRFYNPLQNIRLAMSQYSEEMRALASTDKIPPSEVNNQIIKNAEKLLHDVSVSVSFFKPGSSVFDKHFNRPYQYAVTEHIYGLQNAIELFSQEIASSPIDRETTTAMLGGLTMTVSHLMKFIERHADVEETPVHFGSGGFPSGTFMSPPQTSL